MTRGPRRVALLADDYASVSPRGTLGTKASDLADVSDGNLVLTACYTDIFAKRDGRWQCVASQATYTAEHQKKGQAPKKN